jgi:hypothetical protein
VLALQALPQVVAADLHSLAGLVKAHPEVAQHARAARQVWTQANPVLIDSKSNALEHWEQLLWVHRQWRDQQLPASQPPGEQPLPAHHPNREQPLQRITVINASSRFQRISEAGSSQS